MGTIRVAKLIQSSYVDGPGQRAVLFVQGCPIRCPGCQNRAIWDENGGLEMNTEDIAAELLDTGLPVTISGGEPMAQAGAVAELLTAIRLQRPDAHIVVYSGLVFEDLVGFIAPAFPEVFAVLTMADVLVDGPYIQALDHDGLQWRGSMNQRAIDLNATFAHATATKDGVEFHQVVTLDWDTPILTITEDGAALGAADTMGAIFADDLEPTRRCGEIK